MISSQKRFQYQEQDYIFILQQQNMLNANVSKEYFLNFRSKSSSAIKQPVKLPNQCSSIRPTVYIKETHLQKEFGREVKDNIPSKLQNRLNFPPKNPLNCDQSQVSRNCLQTADCSKSFKQLNTKKMRQLIESIKRTLSIYKNMQSDEVVANRNICSWFNELQQAFLSSNNRQVKIESVQNPYTIQISSIKTYPLQKQNNTNITLLEESNILQQPNLQKVQQLMQQLQCYKRINSEILSMVNQTSEYFTSYRRKYINSKKICRSMKKQFESYMDEIDEILQMINGKQGTTTLQRSIRQILTKLKFKTFDITINNQ